MASQKQIAANRAKAQRSTGSKTALGKMKSSRNALARPVKAASGRWCDLLEN